MHDVQMGGGSIVPFLHFLTVATDTRVHNSLPCAFQRGRKICTKCKWVGAYAIVAIPLLAEGNKSDYAWINRILVVDADREIQKSRLLTRDNITESLADKMLDAQASRARRLAIADDVISNMHDMDALKSSVKRLDRHYHNILLSSQNLAPTLTLPR